MARRLGLAWVWPVPGDGGVAQGGASGRCDGGGA